jgi:hypothetical protein
MFPKVCQVLVICMCIYIFIYIYIYIRHIHVNTLFPMISHCIPILFGKPSNRFQSHCLSTDWTISIYVYIYICTVIYTYLLLTSYDIHKWYVHVYMVCISYIIYTYIYISFAYIYICVCTHGISPCMNVLCVCIRKLPFHFSVAPLQGGRSKGQGQGGATNGVST